MVSKSKWVYGIAMVALSIGLLGLLTGCLSVFPEEGTNDSDISRPAGKVIFEFGRGDKNYGDFHASGLTDITEYRCRVGVDCSTEAFPTRLEQAGGPILGVERIIISFRLEQAYNNVILRLARAGGETTVVNVDRNQTHLATATMLGSEDHGVFGAYDLILGELKKGVHTIQLTVADDGKGNGGYSWDALALIAKKR